MNRADVAVTAPPLAAVRARRWMNWLQPVVLPTRIVRLLALLLSSSLVWALFFFGSQPNPGLSFPAPWDKLVHYLFFGGLAGLFWVLLKGRPPSASIGALLLTACVGIGDETMQAFTRDANRACSISPLICWAPSPQ